MKASTPSQSGAGYPTLSPSLQSLFPPGVVAAQTRARGCESWLHPEEAAAVSRAQPKRVQEFAAGRACARRALRELGCADWVLRVAGDRQPIWPDGVAGSITHTTGFCAAAAVHRSLWPGIGLDCERVDGVSSEVWSTICGDEEGDWISSLPVSEHQAAVALLFSAKEAFYKCQYPVTGEWLDFHDIRIVVFDWSSSRGRFTIQASRRLAIEATAVTPLGQYLFHEGLVLAGVTLSPEAQ